MTANGFSSKGFPTFRSGVPFAPPPYKLSDIGLNLCDSMFKGIYNDKQYHADDLVLVLERAKYMGVSSSIITGTTLEDSLEALVLATNLPSEYNLFCTAGIHPTRSSVFQTEAPDIIINKLRSLIADDATSRVVAIGECGLDYDRLHFCDRATQLTSFLAQLQLGPTLQLPFFLHNRNTNGEFLRVVTEHRELLVRGGVVHSFDGDAEEMLALVALGLHIGINGCSLKTQENLDVVKEIPLESLLIETDAPWCGVKATHAGEARINTVFPTKKRDKYESGFLVKDRCEPCLLVQVAEIVASLKGIAVNDLADATFANSRRLFFPNSSPGA